MNQIQATLKGENSTVEKSLYMALELSERKWKLAFSDGGRVKHQVIDSGATLELHDAIARARRRFGLPPNTPVVSCYEAGRYGFWLHRYLDSYGITNVVVDSSSIEVSRRKRRAKTDRLDAGSLVRMLIRFCAGERRLWSVVRVAQLMSLRGIGITSAWIFEKEFFGWRNFGNRREVGACAGLTPTPYNSGESRREQGISKAGNKRIRTLIVEISWSWLRYQPRSELSRWFTERFAHGGKRMRRIGIVALARKLLIALWRFRTHGLIPEGACLKAIV